MSLPDLNYDTVIDYFNGGYFASAGRIPLFSYVAHINGPMEVPECYLESYDQFVLVFDASGGTGQWLARFDPAFVNNESGSVIVRSRTGLSVAGWSPGEWDRVSGTQALYAHGSTGSDFDLVDPATMAQLGSQPFNGIFNCSAQENGTGSGEDGYWNSTSGNGMWVFFESMGYALCCWGGARISGTFYGKVCFTVDLATGNAIEIVPIPVAYVSAPANEYEAGLWFGSAVDFHGLQFVSDDDSTPTAPKGVLLFQRKNQSTHRVMKLVDWNPTGAPSATGIATRVHCQERWMSKTVVNVATPPLGPPYNHVPHWQGHQVFIQGATGKMMSFSSRNFYTKNIATAHTLADHAMTFEVGTTATASLLSPPVFTGRPETNRTIEAIVHLRGDLAEPIGGESVLFTGQQISEKGEVLDHDGVGGVVYVDYPPIDVMGTTVVYETGVALTDTVDYDVTDFDAGEITFKNGKQLPGEVYTADYRHAQAPSAGARVDILTPASRTDSNGTAVCRVRIPDDDDLVDEWDQITATVET